MPCYISPYVVYNIYEVPNLKMNITKMGKSGIPRILMQDAGRNEIVLDTKSHNCVGLQCGF